MGKNSATLPSADFVDMKVRKKKRIVPGMMAQQDHPPVEKSQTSYKDWVAMALILFGEYIATVTGTKPRRITRAMLPDCSLELPGWKWELSPHAKLNAIPLTPAFSGWKRCDIEAAIEALQNSDLRLVAITPKGYGQREKRGSGTKGHKIQQDKQKLVVPLWYTVVKTESKGLLCGLFALRSSIELQAPWIRTPKIEELRKIATTGCVAQRLHATRLNEDFSKNFTIDHLAAILYQYGLIHGQTLQLGLFWAGRHPYVPMPVDDADATIWVHNSNESGARFNHYSAMKPSSEISPKPSTSPTPATGEACRSRPTSSTTSPILPSGIKSVVNPLKRKKDQMSTLPTLKKAYTPILPPVLPPTTTHSRITNGASMLLTPPISSPTTNKLVQSRAMLRQQSENERSATTTISSMCPSSPVLQQSSPSERVRKTCSILRKQISAALPSIETDVSSEDDSLSSCSERCTESALKDHASSSAHALRKRGGTTFSRKSFVGSPTRNDRSPINLRSKTKIDYREISPLSEISERSVTVAPQQRGNVYDVARIHGELHSSSRPHQFDVEWVDFDERTWVLADDCCCPELIEDYRNCRDNPGRERLNNAQSEELIFVKERKVGQTAIFSTQRSVPIPRTQTPKTTRNGRCRSQSRTLNKRSEATGLASSDTRKTWSLQTASRSLEDRKISSLGPQCAISPTPLEQGSSSRCQVVIDLTKSPLRNPKRLLKLEPSPRAEGGLQKDGGYGTAIQDGNIGQDPRTSILSTTSAGSEDRSIVQSSNISQRSDSKFGINRSISISCPPDTSSSSSSQTSVLSLPKHNARDNSFPFTSSSVLGSSDCRSKSSESINVYSNSPPQSAETDTLHTQKCTPAEGNNTQISSDGGLQINGRRGSREVHPISRDSQHFQNPITLSSPHVRNSEQILGVPPRPVNILGSRFMPSDDSRPNHMNHQPSGFRPRNNHGRQDRRPHRRPANKTPLGPRPDTNSRVASKHYQFKNKRNNFRPTRTPRYTDRDMAYSNRPWAESCRGPRAPVALHQEQRYHQPSHDQEIYGREQNHYNPLGRKRIEDSNFQRRFDTPNNHPIPTPARQAVNRTLETAQSLNARGSYHRFHK